MKIEINDVEPCKISDDDLESIMDYVMKKTGSKSLQIRKEYVVTSSLWSYLKAKVLG